MHNIECTQYMKRPHFTSQELIETVLDDNTPQIPMSVRESIALYVAAQASHTETYDLISERRRNLGLELDYSNSAPWGAIEVSKLFTTLRAKHDLTSLDFSHNKICSNTWAEELSEALATNDCLEILHLSHNYICGSE